MNDVIGNKKDVLYAFAVNGALKYVGKTASTLRLRLQGYKTPPATANSGASTNIKNHHNILAALKEGSAVDIYVLHALPSQEHFGFAVSLATGLEGSLIMSPLFGLSCCAQNRCRNKSFSAALLDSANDFGSHENAHFLPCQHPYSVAAKISSK